MHSPLHERALPGSFLVAPSNLHQPPAIVHGVPKSSQGIVDAALARSSANRKKIAIVGEGRGKRAVTFCAAQHG